MKYTSYIANSWLKNASDEQITIIYRNNVDCFPNLKNETDLRKTLYRANPNTRLYLGVDDNNNIISNLFYTYTDDRKVCHIDTLCISIRGKGYGTDLLSNFLRDRVESEYYTLDVIKNNVAALELYKKFGFKTGFYTDLYYNTIRLIAKKDDTTPITDIETNKLRVVLDIDSHSRVFNYYIRFSTNLIQNIHNINSIVPLITDDFRILDDCQINSGIEQPYYMRVELGSPGQISRASITVPQFEPFKSFVNNINLLFLCIVYEGDIIVIYYNPMYNDINSYENILNDCNTLDNALINNEFNDKFVEDINNSNLPFRVNYCNTLILNSPCDCFINVYSKTLYYTPVFNMDDLNRIEIVTGTNSNCYQGVLSFIRGVLNEDRDNWLPINDKHNMDAVGQFALADFEYGNPHIKSLLGDNNELPFTYQFFGIYNQYLRKVNRVIIEEYDKYMNRLKGWIDDTDITIIIIPLKLTSNSNYYNIYKEYQVFSDGDGNRYIFDDEGKKVSIRDIVHANTIIINKSKNTVEFFEPYGSDTKLFTEEDINVRDTGMYSNIENFLKENFTSLSNFTFKPIQETCPNIGLQQFDIIDMDIEEIYGYCLFWTLLRIDLSVTFPECDSIVFDNIILNYLKASINIRDFIRNYAYRIVKSLWQNHPTFMKIKGL